MSKLEKLLEMQINEMAINLRQKDTGLPMIIWCPTQAGIQHQKPYIKVALDIGIKIFPKDAVSISIETEPKYLRSIKGHKKGEVLGGSWFNPVKDFIVKNYDLLLAHWDNSVGDKEFANRIEKNVGGKIG